MGIVVLFMFIASAIYIQTRGEVQHVKIRRRITDHTNVLGPINVLFYAFSRVPTTPYIDPKLFPELEVLKDNWKTIRSEARQLENRGEIKASDEFDDIGFNSFFKTGWTRFYLKWYGATLLSATKSCPETTRLVDSLPSIKGAMFAMLPPGARLVKHRDPFAGSLRYHLGLETPNDDQCFINVDGKHYSWRDGEVVIFDETYIHYAENKTDQDRIILFLDVKRPVTFAPIDWLNILFSNMVMAASATKNTPGDKVGGLNKAFVYIQKVRMLGKRIKAWNKSVYYILQYGLYLALIYWIFF